MFGCISQQPGNALRDVIGGFIDSAGCGGKLILWHWATHNVRCFYITAAAASIPT